MLFNILSEDRLEKTAMSAVCQAVIFSVLLVAAGCESGSTNNNGNPDPDGDKPVNVEPASLSILQAEHSCAAAACHGGIEQKTDSRIGRNEANLWKMHDPHIGAYDALVGAEGQNMARLLNGENGLPAHKDKRCLACHAPGLMQLAQDDPALDDGMTGLGCMACHGQSTDWVYAHVSWDYANAKPKDVKKWYDDSGMTVLNDEHTRTTLCISCHVGGIDNDRWPHREVNHDLIAAGHPRMHFDNLRFHEALPPHWLPKKSTEDVKDPLRKYAYGQLLAMDAWLELLEYRIESLDKPGSHTVWPEFSEHACFDCHHDLVVKSWRKGNPPNSNAPRWGNYYAAMMPQHLLLLEKLSNEDRTTVTNMLDQMQQAMHSYLPDNEKVLKLANGIRLKLKPHLKDLLSKPNSAAVQEFRLACKKILEDDQRIQTMRWEEAVQLYMAIDTAMRGSKSASFQVSLDKLAESLQFDTAGKVVFESPRTFRLKTDFTEPLRSVQKTFPEN